jgi:hypothetical protein
MKNDWDSSEIEWTRDARLSRIGSKLEPSTMGTMRDADHHFIENVSWSEAQAYAAKKNLPLEQSSQNSDIEWWRDTALTRGGEMELSTPGFMKTENGDVIYGVTLGEAQAYVDERDMPLDILPD